jgi:uroporphyrinogen-III synthase
LVPQSDMHTDEVQKLLDAKKLNHTECVMYRTVSNDFTEEELKHFDYDMLVFFRPNGIKALNKNFPAFNQGKIKIATFGPATAKAVEDEGLHVDLMAPTKENPSMTSALKAFLKENANA